MKVYNIQTVMVAVFSNVSLSPDDGWVSLAIAQFRTRARPAKTELYSSEKILTSSSDE